MLEVAIAALKSVLVADGELEPEPAPAEAAAEPERQEQSLADQAGGGPSIDNAKEEEEIA